MGERESGRAGDEERYFFPRSLTPPLSHSPFHSFRRGERGGLFFLAPWFAEEPDDADAQEIEDEHRRREDKHIERVRGRREQRRDDRDDHHRIAPRLEHQPRGYQPDPPED